MCTVWGSIGSLNPYSETLIAKNRDEDHEYLQALMMIKPQQGYRYFALGYKLSPKEKAYRFFSAGINEKGLVMVNTNATRAHKTHDNPCFGALKENLLARYASVEEVLTDQEKLFKKTAPLHILFGDQKHLALVEIAPNGDYQMQIKTDGALWHTNHYMMQGFEGFNQNISEGTRLREKRMQQLFAKEKTLTMDVFKRFSENQEDGPHSILRECTVASWIVSLPRHAPPKLWVKLFNPHQPKQEETFVLDESFWNTLNLTSPLGGLAE